MEKNKVKINHSYYLLENKVTVKDMVYHQLENTSYVFYVEESDRSQELKCKSSEEFSKLIDWDKTIAED